LPNCLPVLGHLKLFKDLGLKLPRGVNPVFEAGNVVFNGKPPGVYGFTFLNYPTLVINDPYVME
jgi:hypothetical protein